MARFAWSVAGRGATGGAGEGLPRPGGRSRLRLFPPKLRQGDRAEEGCRRHDPEHRIAQQAGLGRLAAPETIFDVVRATLAALINVGESALVTGEEARRYGNAHPQIVPYRVFPAADGELVVAAGTDRQFARLAELVGRPDWATDPEFRTNPARVAHRLRLEAELESKESSRVRRGRAW